MLQVFGVERVTARQQRCGNDQRVPVGNLRLGLDFHRLLNYSRLQRDYATAGYQLAGQLVPCRHVHAELDPTDVQEFADYLHADGRLLFDYAFRDCDLGVVSQTRKR